MEKYNCLMGDVIFERTPANIKNKTLYILDLDSPRKEILSVKNFSFNITKCWLFYSIYDFKSSNQKKLNYDGNIKLCKNFNPNTTFDFYNKFPKVKTIFVEDLNLFNNLKKQLEGKIDVIYKTAE